MDCSPPVSSAQGISQARTLERVAVSPGDLPACPALAGGFFTTESARKPYLWHTYLKKSLVIWESSLAVHLEFYLATLSQTPALLTSVWSPLTGRDHAAQTIMSVRCLYILVCTPVVIRTFWVTVREIQQKLVKGKGSSLADVKPWKTTGLGDWNQEAITSPSAPLPCLASLLCPSAGPSSQTHIFPRSGSGGGVFFYWGRRTVQGKAHLGSQGRNPPKSLDLHVWPGAAVSTRTYQELPAASRFSALESDLRSLHELVNAQVWEPRPRGTRAAISGGLPLGFRAENRELSSVAHQPLWTGSAWVLAVLVNAPGSLQEQRPWGTMTSLGPVMTRLPSPPAFPARCLSSLAPSLRIWPAFPPLSLVSRWLNLKP